MLHLIIHALQKVRPWKGPSYQCHGCGRLTIHTGPCPYCGTHVK